MRNKRESYDYIPSCPACGNEKTIITCRSIDYVEKEYLLQFKCIEGHEWVAKEPYPLSAPTTPIFTSEISGEKPTSH